MNSDPDDKTAGGVISIHEATTTIRKHTSSQPPSIQIDELTLILLAQLVTFRIIGYDGQRCNLEKKWHTFDHG